MHWSKQETVKFWRQIRILDNGCWEWTGGRSSAGYGRFVPWRTQKNKYAHRLSYEYCIGPIPNGLQIDHLCRNRACINPLHMEAVTRKENIRRGMCFSGINARKTHCIHGHPLSGENLYIVYGRGRVERRCRECHRIKFRFYYYRDKAKKDNEPPTQTN